MTQVKNSLGLLCRMEHSESKCRGEAEKPVRKLRLLSQERQQWPGWGGSSAFGEKKSDLG